MTVSKGSDPLTGSPDAASRGAGTSGRSKRLEPTPAALLNLPDPLAAQSFDWATVAQGAGGSAVSFPLQDPVQASTGSGLAPFKVRWHKHGDDKDDGEWEVYLPWGCASVNGTACIPSNEKAEGPDGTEVGWYTFDIATADSVETTRVEDMIYRSWPVYALMKPWPSVTVSTARKDYEDEPWFAKKVIAYAQEAEWTDEEGETHVNRRVVQYTKESWGETTPYSTGLFAIRYEPQGRASDPDTEWKAKLVSMTVTCGRFQTSSDDEPDVTDMEAVVLKINHSTDGEYTLEVVDEMGETGDDATYVTLYKLEDGVVTEDLRVNITTMPFFDV